MLHHFAFVMQPIMFMSLVMSIMYYCMSIILVKHKC